MMERPEALHPTTWTLLRALRAGVRLSRNRNFYLFRDPRARRAIRTHRFLRSIIRDVRERGDDVRVRVLRGDEDHAVALRIDIPMLHGHRTAYLHPFELELLAADAPEVAALLKQRAEA